MAITYSIDTTIGVIFEVWEGDVTAADLRRYWEGYLADPEVMALRRTLVDLREARIQFSGLELMNLVAAMVTPVLQGRDWKTALVVARPVQYGVSRQYQVFAEHYSQDAIFEDYDEALRWLTQKDKEFDLSLWTSVPSPDDLMTFPISHFIPLLSKRMQRILSELGIHTVGELSQVSVETLDEHGAGGAGPVEIEVGILKPKGLSLRRRESDGE